MSLFKSVQFGHLYRKLHNRNLRNLLRKGRVKSPCVSLECAIRIWFLWREDQIYTRHCSKQTSKLSQLQKKKNLNLLTITFLAVYLMNKGKSSYMNESSMRVNNTFR